MTGANRRRTDIKRLKNEPLEAPVTNGEPNTKALEKENNIKLIEEIHLSQDTQQNTPSKKPSKTPKFGQYIPSAYGYNGMRREKGPKSSRTFGHRLCINING